MSRKTFLAILAGVLLLLAWLTLYGFPQLKPASYSPPQTTSTSSIAQPAISSSTAWSLYQSGQYGVYSEIMYPPNWTWNGATYAINPVGIQTNLYTMDQKPYSQIPGIIAKDQSQHGIHFLEPTSTVTLKGADASGADLQATELYYTYLYSGGVTHYRRVAYIQAISGAGSAYFNIVSIDSTSSITSSNFGHYLSTFRMVAGPVP